MVYTCFQTRVIKDWQKRPEVLERVVTLKIKVLFYIFIYTNGRNPHGSDHFLAGALVTVVLTAGLAVYTDRKNTNQRLRALERRANRTFDLNALQRTRSKLRELGANADPKQMIQGMAVTCALLDVEITAQSEGEAVIEMKSTEKQMAEEEIKYQTEVANQAQAVVDDTRDVLSLLATVNPPASTEAQS